MKGRAPMLAGAAVATVAASIAFALAFSFAVDASSRVFSETAHVAALLPLVGLETYVLYRLMRVPFGMATGVAIESLRRECAGAAEIGAKADSGLGEKTDGRAFEMAGPFSSDSRFRGYRAASERRASEPDAGQGFLGGMRRLDDAAVPDELPVTLMPAIFLGTCLTILCGGSVGKEAGALQMSSAIASIVRRLFKVDKKHLMMLASCGMAAALGVLLGMPLASALLSLELMRNHAPGAKGFAAIIASAFFGAVCARLAGLPGLEAAAASGVLPDVSQSSAFLLIALGSAAAGALFCFVVTRGRAAVAALPVPMWLPLVIGGTIAAAALLSMPGVRSFSGTGMDYVVGALAGKVTTPYFLGKLAFTAFLLALGFKGGEIMPTMCIGATCGCFLGSAFDIDPGFAAAVGLVAGMAAAANCPLAACLLGIEAFGLAGAGWFMVAAALSFACTLPLSLYGNTFSYRRLGAAIRRMSSHLRGAR